MDEICWKPSASIEILRARADIFALIRNFFRQRACLEVETPIMARFGISDLHLANIKARFRNQVYNLQTSPEYHMKRLLAAGSGSIFQIARVFRDDELGRWHNPEFSLLEWYRLDIDHHELMLEVDELLQLILKCNPIIKKTYREVFMQICKLDPMSASIESLQDLARYFDLQNVFAANTADRDDYLFLLMSHVIEPTLAKEQAPIAVFDFPISQASLAKIDQGVAQRFEVYYKGVELANGFCELSDAVELAARFERDNCLRLEHNLEACLPDTYLLAAMQHGLPACSGVALGLERLLALVLEQDSIAKVSAFDFSRA